jgi:NAD(P)-dependent dehydrogenase (short-subunit alcohol dehydrogenase family)
MRRAGGGSIINISSGAGIAPAPGTSAAYAATKGGVRIFSKATAVQHAKDGIRCNSVHPGPVDTPMVRGPQTDPARLAELTGRVPLGRLGTSEEIAYGVLYLASDESSYVTGSELVIDGGRTAQKGADAQRTTGPAPPTFWTPAWLARCALGSTTAQWFGLRPLCVGS